jgi:hypothetical protein
MDALDIELYASLAIIGATLIIGAGFVGFFIKKINNSREE